MTQPNEPSLKFNGYSISILHVISLMIFIFGGGGAWYTVQAKLDYGIGDMQRRLSDLQSDMERNRQERMADTKEMRDRVELLAEHTTRQDEQIKSLFERLAERSHGG